MFNVEISKKDLETIEKKGYCFIGSQENENMKTIRQYNGEAVAEIIYLPEKHELLVMTRKQYLFCKYLAIKPNEEGILINYVDNGAKMLSIEIEQD